MEDRAPVNGHRELDIKLRISAASLYPSKNQIRSIDHPLTHATVNHHQQTRKDDISEFMINGLRLTDEGVSPQIFRDRFGLEVMDVYGNEIRELTNLGLLERTNKTSEDTKTPEVLRLTSRGRLLGNQVFLRFV
jgi:coproporphyrinogen III oxidase-like Fe-S oxidoreductase